MQHWSQTTILLLHKIPNECRFNLRGGGSVKLWGRICYYRSNFLWHVFRTLCSLNSKAYGDIAAFLSPSKITINFVLETCITVFIKNPTKQLFSGQGHIPVLIG